MAYEVRILIFDDPAEQEEQQVPEFCFTQVYSTSSTSHDTKFSTVDLQLYLGTKFSSRIIKDAAVGWITVCLSLHIISKKWP